MILLDDFIQNYAVHIIFVLTELLLAVVIFRISGRLRQKYKKSRTYKNGEKIYGQIISEGTKQSHILIDLRSSEIIFSMKNLKDVIGVSAEEFKSNRRKLINIMGKTMAFKLREMYDKWGGSETLRFDFKSELTGLWIRLEVSRDENAGYELVIFSNIDSEKHQELKLIEQLKKAEEESDSKTKFLSRMSHEIRTPMNGVMGMITLAGKNAAVKENAEVRNYLEKAEKSSEYLLSLINDILDMSRIEAGKMELVSNVIDIETLREQLDDMFRKTLEEKGVEYIVELIDIDTRYILADELRLKQVIINFLSNAVKFTKEGEVRVTFREMSHDNDMTNLMIRVHDTGKGMSPDFVNRIFKPFDQENENISRDYGGTGLGMAITDQIIRLMGGEIIVESMPGKGSDFSIYLEVKAADKDMIAEAEKLSVDSEEEQIDDEEISLEGLNILIAEDNAINAEIMCSMLDMEGINAVLAGNGRIAVEKFKESEPGYFDLILMDIQMPEMNGYEATKVIRTLDREDAKSIIIYALSADAFVEDKRRSQQAGMNDHMSKPIDFVELKKKIRQHKAAK